jgi:hydroxymethylbilane synthase
VKLRIGTRGSALARAQTALVAAALEGRGLSCEMVTIRTLGDQHPDRPAVSLGVGAFVREIEAALLAGRVDIAVHSAKDLPGESTPGLMLAAFMPREDPRDALVTRDGIGLRALAPGSVVGTGSPRRRAFLLAAYPSLLVRELRGNVDTRIRKLEAGEVDALVIAAAGLERLGLGHRAAERLDPAVMLPAVGQGAVVIQCCSGQDWLCERLSAMDHPPTRAAMEAERAFLAALGGGCQRPIAALATTDGTRLRLQGAVLGPSGERIVRDQAEGDTSAPVELGRRLAARLLDRGAGELLAEAVR